MQPFQQMCMGYAPGWHHGQSFHQGCSALDLNKIVAITSGVTIYRCLLYNRRGIMFIMGPVTVVVSGFQLGQMSIMGI